MAGFAKAGGQSRAGGAALGAIDVNPLSLPCDFAVWIDASSARRECGDGFGPAPVRRPATGPHAEGERRVRISPEPCGRDAGPHAGFAVIGGSSFRPHGPGGGRSPKRTDGSTSSRSPAGRPANGVSCAGPPGAPLKFR